MISQANQALAQMLTRLADRYFDALQAMTGVSIGVVSAKDYLADTFSPWGTVTCMVDFTGSNHGFLAISLAEETAAKILGAGNGTPVDIDRQRDDLSDFLKETLNAVSGDCLDLLQDEDGAVTMLPPKVIYGTVSYPRNACLTRGARTSVGPIYFTVSTDAMQLEVNRVLERLKKPDVGTLVKSQFLANMSYEIRAPMNGILGTTAVLMDTDLTSTQRGLGQTIWRCAEELQMTLGDLLDYARIEAGRLDLESMPFDLRVTIEDIVHLLESAVSDRGQQLQVEVANDLPRHVIGDPSRVRRVITNLIAKTSQLAPEGVVKVNLDAITMDQGPGLKITVTAGARPSTNGHSTSLPDLWSKIDAGTTLPYGGGGLGLVVAKQLATMMGGEVGVEEGPSGAHAVWGTMPVKVDSAGSPPALPTADLTGVSILLAEASDANRVHMAERLKSWGMQVEHVSNGISALDALQTACTADSPYKMMLVREQLPDIDPVTFAKKVHEDPNLGGPVFTYMASTGKHGDARKLEQHGAAAYLIRPAWDTQLFEVLRAAWGARVAKRDVPLITRHTIAEAWVESVQQTTRTNGLRALVVDDNLVSQQVAVRLLERLGCHADVAGNGHRATEMVGSTPYHIVFMDCQMPEMDGFTATAEIRKQESDRRVPIVAMTANAMLDDEEKCLASGMDDFVSKPVQVDVLRQTLARWTGGP